MSNKEKNASVNQAVIDFDQVKRLLKDKKTFEECRQMMISSITEDLIKLKKHYQAQNWNAIEGLAHKWQGASSYFKAKRLREACKRFGDYQRQQQSEKKQEKLVSLYFEFIHEMEAVKEACCNYQE